MSTRNILLLNQQAVIHCVCNLLWVVTHRQRLYALNSTELASRDERDITRIEVVDTLLHQVGLTVGINTGLADISVGLTNLDGINLNHLANGLLVDFIVVEDDEVRANLVAADVTVDVVSDNGSHLAVVQQVIPQIL